MREIVKEVSGYVMSLFAAKLRIPRGKRGLLLSAGFNEYMP